MKLMIATCISIILILAIIVIVDYTRQIDNSLYSYYLSGDKGFTLLLERTYQQELRECGSENIFSDDESSSKKYKQYFSQYCKGEHYCLIKRLDDKVRECDKLKDLVLDAMRYPCDFTRRHGDESFCQQQSHPAANVIMQVDGYMIAQFNWSDKP